MDFIEALRTVTYELRMQKTSRECQVKFTEAWNSHLQAEGTETSRESQVDFTEA